MAKKKDRLLIGWREWMSLPALRIPHIKAKIDTGAKTSAIHASHIEVFFEKGKQRVRFRVQPIQGHGQIHVQCEADVIDQRVVSDSGGHRERRYVIETTLQIGDLCFPIEMTLANREAMSFRMLLGRSAMRQLQIDPTQSFLLGKPKKPRGAYKKRSK